MFFQKIVEAGIKQDAEALGAMLKVSNIDEFKFIPMDELKVGTDHCSPVQQLAMDGDFHAVEFLISYGANIDYAAQGAAIGGHIDFVETLLARGANIHDSAQAAAIGGHKDFVEALLVRGANIDYAIRGAALGGHKNFVKELLVRGANINCVIEGAALGGHKDFIEELLVRGANINCAIENAALGGHKDLVEELLVRGADIHDAIRGATNGGHQDLVEALLIRGANIYAAAGVAVYRGHISTNKKSHILFLSFYKPETILAFTKEFKRLNTAIIIDESTEKRAIAISKNLHQGIVNYSEALIRTDPQCQGMLYLMVSLVMKHSAQLPNEIASIPLEVWNHIFNFITPAPLDIKGFERLGFVTGRAFLRAQLSGYQSGWGIHKERAESFFQEVSCVSTKKDLYDLVANQTQILLGNNPYPLTQQDKKHKSNVTNATLDKYHGIIGFWEEMYTGGTVDFQDKQAHLKQVMQL